MSEPSPAQDDQLSTRTAERAAHGVDTAAPPPETSNPPVRRPRFRRRPTLTGAAMLVGGILLAWIGVALHLTLLATAVAMLVGSLLAMTGLGRLVEGIRGRRVDIVFILGATWLVVLVAVAALAPWLPIGNHDDSVAALSAPIFEPPQGIGGEYPLGTNNYGLDMFARTVHGARTSLIVAMVAVLIGIVVGGAVGMVAGFFGGATDRVIGILANALLAVPPLILLIAMGTVLSPNLRNVAIALSLLTIPSMVRLARANTIAFSQREFVLAAKSIGATRWRLITRELLPNVALPVMSLAVVMISMLIVAEASLSFLGLGIKPPEPTWGNMIAEGQSGVMEEHPFIVIVPGVCLFLTVFAFNLLGEKAQKRWDPRSAKL